MSTSRTWRSASTTSSDGASATAPELAAVLADVDPFRLDQFGHAQRIDAKRAARRACSRHDFVERFQRDVAVDRHRCCQAKRADAAYRMAGDRRDLLRRQHAGLAAEGRLDLLV